MIPFFAFPESAPAHLPDDCDRGTQLKVQAALSRCRRCNTSATDVASTVQSKQGWSILGGTRRPLGGGSHCSDCLNVTPAFAGGQPKSCASVCGRRAAATSQAPPVPAWSSSREGHDQRHRRRRKVVQTLGDRARVVPLDHLDRGVVQCRHHPDRQAELEAAHDRAVPQGIRYRRIRQPGTLAACTSGSISDDEGRDRARRAAISSARYSFGASAQAMARMTAGAVVMLADRLLSDRRGGSRTACRLRPCAG